MTLKAQMESDLDSVFMNTDEFGTSITTSASETITGIVDYGQVLGEWQLSGQAAMATVTIKKADMAAPARYNTLTIDGVEWRIESCDQGDGYTWLLTVSRDRRVS